MKHIRSMTTQTQQHIAHRINYWAVLSVLLGSFLGNLDSSIANVALPTIAHDLSRPAAQTVWVVTAYQLAVAMSVLPLASLGEMFGFRRVFLGGVVVFTAASLACAAAPSLPLLIASRALQGVGGASMSTVVPALLRQVYPPKLVGRGIALLGLAVALSAALGPTVAAGILSVAGWRWLFAVNVPLGIFGLCLASAMLPRIAPSVTAARRFDFAGALLSAGAIALFILGVGGLGAGEGETAAAHVTDGAARLHALPLIEIALACIAGFALIRQQRGRSAPLVPLDLLRIPILALSGLTSICSYVAQTLAYVALPFMLQHQLTRTATTTGLLVTPWPLVIVFVAPLAGRLSDRHAPGLIGGIGLAIMAAGLCLLIGLPASPSNADIVWRVALCGIGFGFFQTPNNRIMLTAAPHERSGAAGGLMTMARMIGLSLGAALAAVAFGLYGQGGAQVALVGAAVSAALGVIVGVVRVVRVVRTR
ncbi:MFS transporter [Caballeronia ptereochthonis]|uniref:Major facilitator transporter n=1 Tax=Caballeronia ptereochthonis TaxID=1777144 RepID=A0A158DEH1_9BURK|nr:MFS transporter [Caballeronia ptereochthonis]SAK93005.1 major facilitator transporter [Caballeronia ptereochthonis]